MKLDDADIGEIWETFRALEKLFGRDNEGLRRLRFLVAAGVQYERKGGSFQVGDRVRLKESPDFDRAPGWRRHADILRPGAEGVVRSKELWERRGGFGDFVHGYYVVFFEDPDFGKKFEEANFYFGDSKLELVTERDVSE